MEYQKIIILSDDTTNQPSKFRTRNWGEINVELRGEHNDDDDNNFNNKDNNNIKFKTSMIRSSLCDYSDAYILVKGTMIVPNTAAEGTAVNNTNKKVENTQVDYAEDIDIVMPMYNLIEYSNAYSKT